MPSFLLGFDGELFAEVNGKPIREGDKASKIFRSDWHFTFAKNIVNKNPKTFWYLSASVPGQPMFFWKFHNLGGQKLLLQNGLDNHNGKCYMSAHFVTESFRHAQEE